MEILLRKHVPSLAERVLLVVLLGVLAVATGSAIGLGSPARHAVGGNESGRTGVRRGLPTGAFGDPAAGHWVFAGSPWRFAVERLGSAAMESWLDRLATVDALTPSSGVPSPAIVDLVREHASRRESLGGGRVIYRLERPSLRLRLLVLETAAGSRLLAARGAVPRGPGGWLGMTATATSGGVIAGRGSDSLLPWPPGAKRLAERRATDATVVCELRSVPGRLDSWLGDLCLARADQAAAGGWLHDGDSHWHLDARGWVMLRGRYDARLDATICLAVVVGREGVSSHPLSSLDDRKERP
jgi:hypothetical protein